MPHDPFIDDALPLSAQESTSSEPRLAAGTINRVSGSGASAQVWCEIDGFDGYEWGPLEHRPFAEGEAPLVGARCAVGIFSDEKWLVGTDETLVTAATWYTTTSAPAAGLGAEGDLALDTTNNAWYGPKHLGAWGAAHSLVTPVIPPSFLVGTGVPAAGTGRDADAYIDKATGLLYSPKAAGAWPAGALLPPALTMTAKSAAYTAVSGDYVACTGSFTVTLPAPTAGRIVGVRSVNGTGAAPVTISTPSGAILGPGVASAATSITLGKSGAFVTLLADGTNWSIVAGTQDTGWIAVTFTNGWSNHTGDTCQYRKIGPLVYTTGYMAAGTAGASAFTLPAGFRPVTEYAHAVNAVGVATLLYYQAAGTVVCTTAPAYINLAASFPCEL